MASKIGGRLIHGIDLYSGKYGILRTSQAPISSPHHLCRAFSLFRIRENRGPLFTCCYQERYFLASGYFRHPRKKSPLLTLSEFKYTVSLHQRLPSKAIFVCLRTRNLFATKRQVCGGFQNEKQYKQGFQNGKKYQEEI